MSPECAERLELLAKLCPGGSFVATVPSSVRIVPESGDAQSVADFVKLLGNDFPSGTVFRIVDGFDREFPTQVLD